jgi:hypothetical protein
MVARLASDYEALCGIAAGMVGEIGFDAALAKIQARGEMFPIGHEDRETLRRVYAHIAGIRRESALGLTANNYKMGGRSQVTAEVAARALEASAPRVGTFTVVMGTERRTIRIKKHWDAAEASKGTLVASYLSGQDNESSYTGFAFVTPRGKAIVWKKYRNGGGSALIISALSFLLQSGDYEGAGLAYALESGNCYRCGRTLTVPASINRGLGPECAKKVA